MGIFEDRPKSLDELLEDPLEKFANEKRAARRETSEDGGGGQVAAQEGAYFHLQGEDITPTLPLDGEGIAEIARAARSRSLGAVVVGDIKPKQVEMPEGYWDQPGMAGA